MIYLSKKVSQFCKTHDLLYNNNNNHNKKQKQHK